MSQIDIASLERSDLIHVIKERLVASKPNADTICDGDHLLNPEFQDWVVGKAIKPAAVLIPIVERANGMQVVFTRRTQKLKSHSGQVSFPGGKIDANDTDPVMAALRETHEEIGVAPHKVELIGQLRDYFTGSGYQISPVIGMVASDAEFVANPDEVDQIFEVPLSFLMTPENQVRGSRVFKEKERFFYELRWNEHYIWGVTAGIVNVFYNRIFK